MLTYSKSPFSPLYIWKQSINSDKFRLHDISQHPIASHYNLPRLPGTYNYNAQNSR